MTSYYKNIIGDIAPGQLARSEDIHLIQSSIKEMISRVIVDMFGPSFILGHDEDLLTLTPVPLHSDQSNLNYDQNNCWLSFYERYIAQEINTEKSEIHSIKTHMKNKSNLTVSIFAEIRDYNFNLIREVNTELPPTLDNEYEEVTFEFNIEHLPVGTYIFIIRSIDLSRVDLMINGDESDLDTITSDMFQVRFDINGNYCNGLYASYNATDYLPALMLEDLIVNDEDVFTELLGNNPDLYFEQTFSEGNTYLITPGPAIILGEKVYPVDTHVTIDGPSTMGNRTDLVTLTNDGRLNVIKGDVYTGETKYPTSNIGLKIAYITSYKSSSTTWECPTCGAINQGNIETCEHCNTVTNSQIPLVEQADDDNTTRQRDILERLRRLEKKVDYDMDRNSPSRIKYLCTLDPYISKPTWQTITDANGHIKVVEDTEGNYGYTTTINDKGETVYIPETGYKVEQLYYSIKDRVNENTKIPDYIKAGDDSFYKDGVSVDTKSGVITLQKADNGSSSEDKEFSKNKTLKELGTYKSQEITYTIKGDSDLGELNSEYAVLNFTLNSDTYIKTLTPYITKFQNIEKFGIILFRNDEVFNLTKTTRICYQKKFKDDPTFPNVYESEMKSLEDVVSKNTGIVTLNEPISFSVNQEIPAGNYSLLVYGILKDGTKEGTIYITEYSTLSETDTYGISTKCLGTTNPSLVYLETNNISNRSWDLVFEKRNATYFNRGTLISKSYSTSQRIYSCSLSINTNIPAGCSIEKYVSNNGGRTWVNASSGKVTFSGTGNSFRFKLILNGTNENSPQILYNPSTQYALLFNIGTAIEYVEWEDYKSCFETKMIDANYYTSFLLGQPTSKRFSEWEFCRLWISHMENITVDICFSSNEDYEFNLSGTKESFVGKIFYDTIFADLQESDFQRTSVDYDNYDDSVEVDEYNYRFELDEDYQYNYTNGEIISTGTDGLGDINSEYINVDDFYYTVHQRDIALNEDNYHLSTSGYTSACFKIDNLEKNEAAYYTSWSDPYFNKNKVIIGKQFPEGLEITNNYSGLSLNITPFLVSSGDDAFDKATRYYVGDKMAIPAGTLEIVVALNLNGAIEDDNATYGKAYTINQTLINEKETTVSLPSEFAEDLYAYKSIKSIGIRVKDKPKLKTTYNNGFKNVTVEYSQTLRCYKQTTSDDEDDYLSDSIGLGLIMLNGYTIQHILPLNTQKALLWENISNSNNNSVYLSWIPKIRRTKDGALTRWTIPKNGLPTEAMKSEFPNGCKIRGLLPIGIADSPSRDIAGNPIYNSDGYLEGKSLDNYDYTIQTLYTDINLDEPTRYWSYDDNYESGGVYWAINNHTGDFAEFNHKLTFTDIAKEQLTDYGGIPFFYMGEGETGNLFKLKVDAPLTLKEFFKVSYYIPEFYISNPINSDTESNVSYSNGYYTEGNFNKGEIFIDLYDTEDIEHGALPIQSLALPAWGRIQSSSKQDIKVCNTWYRKRTNATKVKTIVIRRENPTGKTVSPVFLALRYLMTYQAKNIPSLGSKMTMRLYPNDLTEDTIPALRKYGGIWTLK